MKKNFDVVRHALEEHLSAINENTTEIQAMFDYLQEMEVKIDKLTQRVDNLQLNVGQPVEKPFIGSLNQLEKKVFLILYTEETPLSYSEISEKSRIPFSVVSDCISSLIKKGVPLLRSSVNAQMFFKLSPTFKEMQAKQNVINLSLESFIE